MTFDDISSLMTNKKQGGKEALLWADEDLTCAMRRWYALGAGAQQTCRG